MKVHSIWYPCQQNIQGWFTDYFCEGTLLQMNTLLNQIILRFNLFSFAIVFSLSKYSFGNRCISWSRLCTILVIFKTTYLTYNTIKDRLENYSSDISIYRKGFEYVFNRFLSKFVDRWAHETMHTYIGNKHFFTKSFRHQTYQNSKISWQKLPISDFQSDFSMSKIIRIFLIFFFIEEYQFRGTYIVIGINWKLQFLKPFISKIKHIFCQLILEFW